MKKRSRSGLVVTTSFALAAVLCLGSCRAHPGAASQGRLVDGEAYSLVLADDVVFDQLNPARGDASPLAGTVWGDRGGAVATGFLFRPVDGFQSPPHVHNVTYRGVVIRGEVHNAHPAAPRAWMPAGSFWTQPKGQVHITAAQGTDTLAYIEIDRGPYLVWPVEQGFDTRERPLNVDVVNLVWANGSSLLGGDGAGAQVAQLWDSGEARGVMVKVPGGETASLGVTSGTLRGMVVGGRPSYWCPARSGPVELDPGSFFASRGPALHRVHAEPGEETVLYVRIEGSAQLLGSN